MSISYDEWKELLASIISAQQNHLGKLKESFKQL